MWSSLARSIIKFRLPLMLLLALVTAFMAYQIPKLTLSHDYVAAVPPSDPSMEYYRSFRQQFGEDANVLVVGVQDSALYEVQTFRRFKYLSDAISELDGVKYVVSLPNLQQLVKNTEAKAFETVPVFPQIPSEQAALDSLLQVANDLKFYSRQLVNPNNGATFLLVAIESETLNSDKRLQLVPDIQMLSEQFSEATGVALHYAGIPFVRTVMNQKIKAELRVFLILSVAVTALILLLFFRSWDAVVFPLLVIAIMVVWSLGTLVLLGYEITVLTGLLPPIIVIIGIPNSVYLINKYHQEYKRYQDRTKALRGVIEKMGTATLITNVTTAIGFLVLMFTNVPILEEFGLVVGINILATFVVSIILIPSVFSYLPAPSDRQLRHLRFKAVDRVLTGLDLLVHRHRYRVLTAAALITALFLVGFTQLRSVSYLVDDVPSDSPLKQDLAFFEENFSGIMPLEIVVDTHKKRSVTRLSTLQKVDAFEQFLGDHPAISQPVSVVGFVKAARQAFYNNDPAFYELPTRRDQGFILRYLKNSGMTTALSESTTADAAGDQSSTRLLRSFADSTGQQLRISLKVADVGSRQIQTLIDETIVPKADSLFGDSDAEVKITGTSLLFAKGNEFLINNLLTSLFIAFCLIAAIMALLFGSVRMILISLIPNLIPLIVTAGIMGLVGIPLKPSTALIFSIVFGISVDDSIHFLAKYRQELKSSRFFVPVAISKSLRETGTSMMYTSVILFFGFIIFAGSSFGGTQNLGILTSLTLFVAMLTNLTILPSLLMIFDNGKKMALRQGSDVLPVKPLIEHYDEFYQEDEDEEIDVNKLELPDREQEEV